MTAPGDVQQSRTSESAGPYPQRTAGGVDETLVPRWVPYLFAVLSLALVPGIARVFASAAPLHLVTHWRLAWGGFDVALAALLAATGLALFRRSALAEVLAAMTATLLCCDAWLDVLSSVGQGRSATVAAIGEAAFAELPLAALFTWVAARFARAVAARSGKEKENHFCRTGCGFRHPARSPDPAAAPRPPGRRQRSASDAVGRLCPAMSLRVWSAWPAIRPSWTLCLICRSLPHISVPACPAGFQLDRDNFLAGRDVGSSWPGASAGPWSLGRPDRSEQAGA